MPKSFQLVYVDCPVCGNKKAEEVFETMDYQFMVTEQTFRVQKCLKCGAGFLSPRPKKEDIPYFYGEEFYWAHEGGKQKGTAEDLLHARKMQLEVKSDILSCYEKGKLLDIGTQKGEFLYWMRNEGWKVEGVEFSETPERLFDVPIQYGEFTEIGYGSDVFDCVTMWAVLEHIYEPTVYVQEVYKVLKPGGHFVGVVTNFNCPQGRWYGKDDYPRHLTVFTKKSLKYLLEGAGFEVKRFWTDQQLFGGPLRGGIVFGLKRLLGYSRHEVMREWHDRSNPYAFCAEFRGKSSWWIKQVSRLDKVILTPLELLLDRLGMGQNLYWEAVKVSRGSDDK